MVAPLEQPAREAASIRDATGLLSATATHAPLARWVSRTSATCRRVSSARHCICHSSRSSRRGIARVRIECSASSTIDVADRSASEYAAEEPPERRTSSIRESEP